MGFNTTVIVLNDAVHNMADDPEFAKKLQAAIHHAAGLNPERPIDVSILGHVNAASVVACAHADVMQVIAIGGNTGFVLGQGRWSNSEHQLLRQLAEQHGFRLVKDKRKGAAARTKCRDCKADAPYGTCLDCKTPLVKTEHGVKCPKNREGYVSKGHRW